MEISFGLASSIGAFLPVDTGGSLVVVSTGLGVSTCFLSSTSDFDDSMGLSTLLGASTTDLDSGLGDSSLLDFTETLDSSSFGSSGFLVTSGWVLDSSGLGLS